LTINQYIIRNFGPTKPFPCSNTWLKSSKLALTAYVGTNARRIKRDYEALQS